VLLLSLVVCAHVTVGAMGNACITHRDATKLYSALLMLLLLSLLLLNLYDVLLVDIEAIMCCYVYYEGAHHAATTLQVPTYLVPTYLLKLLRLLP
jgi:hypothetical protein